MILASYRGRHEVGGYERREGMTTKKSIFVTLKASSDCVYQKRKAGYNGEKRDLNVFPSLFYLPDLRFPVVFFTHQRNKKLFFAPSLLLVPFLLHSLCYCLSICYNDSYAFFVCIVLHLFEKGRFLSLPLLLSCCYGWEMHIHLYVVNSFALWDRMDHGVRECSIGMLNTLLRWYVLLGIHSTLPCHYISGPTTFYA